MNFFFSFLECSEFVVFLISNYCSCSFRIFFPLPSDCGHLVHAITTFPHPFQRGINSDGTFKHASQACLLPSTLTGVSQYSLLRRLLPFPLSHHNLFPPSSCPVPTIYRKKPECFFPYCNSSSSSNCLKIFSLSFVVHLSFTCSISSPKKAAFCANQRERI